VDPQGFSEMTPLKGLEEASKRGKAARCCLSVPTTTTTTTTITTTTTAAAAAAAATCVEVEDAEEGVERHRGSLEAHESSMMSFVCPRLFDVAAKASENDPERSSLGAKEPAPICHIPRRSTTTARRSSTGGTRRTSTSLDQTVVVDAHVRYTQNIHHYHHHHHHH